MPSETQDTTTIPLTASNMVGIIQRNLMELHAYLTQPAQTVDRMVCLRALEDCAKWVSRLPDNSGIQVPPADNGKQAKARAN